MNDEKLKELHRAALETFDEIAAAQWDERAQCREDRRFAWVAGAQYEGEWGAMFENRPKPEVNKIQAALTRQLNEYRANRMSATFVPKDGTKSDVLANACAGLYRADQTDSTAQEAFDVAFDEASAGGFGAWRLRNVFDAEDGSTDFQRITFEPITDADLSVFFDLNAKRQDKSDAKKCFVLYSITAKAAREKYDIDVTTWPAQRDAYGGSFDWCNADVVYLAEYYEVEEKKDKIVTYTMLDGEKEKRVLSSLDAEDLSRYELLRDKNIPVSERPITTRKVHKYLLCGDRVLEDYGYIAGPNIPIVPVYGKLTTIGGIERYVGMVRYAKDSQRLQNMQVAVLTEIASQSSTEIPIVTHSQIAGNELNWSKMNVERPAYALLNDLVDANGNSMPTGPVGYTKPPSLPPAMAALLQITQQDLKDILGDSSGGEKLLSNTSAQAIQLTQTRIDAHSFVYMDNMAKAHRRSAEIWLGMAKEIYTGDDRAMKSIDDLEEVGTINMAETEVENERPRLKYDLARANFGVQIDIGPASQSRRQKTVQDLLGLMAVTQDPATQAVLNSMVMLNMDGEGVHQLKEYFRKQLLMAGAIKPTDEEKAMMDEIAGQEQKPDPQAEYLMAQAAKAMADAEKAKAEAQATLQDNSPQAAQAKAMADAAKYQADAQRAEIEAQSAREAQEFEREKMQRDTERQIMELAARRQELEMQLEIEAVKGQASIDVAQSTKGDQIQALNQQIEDMANKMQVEPAQPIVIQSGSKTFTIQRTPNGYKGQIQE